MNNTKNVALVTGASSGIGEAISRELVKRGWTVVGVARSESKLAQIQHELSDSFIPMVCDVSKKKILKRHQNKSSKRTFAHPCFF